MNDRLRDLKGGSGEEGGETKIDIKPEKQEYAQPKFMLEFFKDVEAVKTEITKIKDATKLIQQLNDEAVMATSADREKEISAELKKVIDDTNVLAATAKGTLQRLKDETNEKKKDPKMEKSELRIRENLLVTLTRKFVDTMKEYQNCQTKYKTDIKKKVKRQVQYVKPDATSEEIDEVLRTGDTSQIYKTAILKGNASEAIQHAFMSAHDKYQDVIRLERSVAELHQMFLDLALLVDQQGEMLDLIEHQVQSASDYIEKGNEEIQKAIETQKSTRKKQCMLLIIGLVIVAIFVGVFSGIRL